MTVNTSYSALTENLTTVKVPGQYGGYWRGSTKIYGRLDCPSAERWIKKGHYVQHRVFFASEKDAQRAGFRPCKVCMKDRWHSDGTWEPLD